MSYSSMKNQSSAEGPTPLLSSPTPFDVLNAQAHTAMNEEQQKLVEQYRQTQTDGTYVNFMTPTVASIVSISATCPPTTGHAGYITGKHMLRAAITSAVTTLVAGLPHVLSKQGSERNAAIANLLKDVAMNAGISGAAAYLVHELQTFLAKKLPEILSLFSKAPVALVSTTAIRAGAGALFGAAMHSLAALWHAALALAAKLDRDPETVADELRQAKEHVSLDNAIQVTTQAVAYWAISSATAAGCAVLATGVPYAILLGLTSLVVSKITTTILTHKNVRGGWLSYLRSFFQEDRRVMVWSGNVFDTEEDRITEELRCGISKAIV
ncbi:hypothetical protein MBLNU457_5478t2 [Dothideomycetes sp. NU457]